MYRKPRLITSAYPSQNKKKRKIIFKCHPLKILNHSEVRIVTELDGRALCLFYKDTMTVKRIGTDIARLSIHKNILNSQESSIQKP